jgi:hypothetical protein
MASFAIAENSQPVIAVIIDSKQTTSEHNVSTKNLNLIYWRKQRFWPNGVPIKPVNLRSQNPLRIQFSLTTLGSTPNSQIDYWNGQYFNGISPPHSVDSEEAVIRYVAQTKGAIGYVNACNVDARVTALLWIQNGRLISRAPDLSCE